MDVKANVRATTKAVGKAGKEPASVIWVMQGGAALGAYQAGIYEAMAGTRYSPDWIAGVSIGAINGAIIAGNPPERRVERLREMWGRFSSHLSMMPEGDSGRTVLNFANPLLSLMWGVPGFFTPQPLYQWAGAFLGIVPNSFYTIKPLAATLEELIDFDLINQRKTRLSVGAVDVETGKSVYFDNYHQEIRPEHIMASAALPPLLEPVEINGKAYWDGGIVTDTPLDYVLNNKEAEHALILQAEVFSEKGKVPLSPSGAVTRRKDILYSSRTQYITSHLRRLENMRHVFNQLVADLPKDLQNHPSIKQLKGAVSFGDIEIVNLFYRPAGDHLDAKDQDFSRATVEARWLAGYKDMRFYIDHPESIKQTSASDAVTTFDAGAPQASAPAAPAPSAAKATTPRRKAKEARGDGQAGR